MDNYEEEKNTRKAKSIKVNCIKHVIYELFFTRDFTDVRRLPLHERSNVQ